MERKIRSILKNYNKYTNQYLNTTIRKPKIEVTTENYKYLQLFDLIENKDEIIYNFIKDNRKNIMNIFEIYKKYHLLENLQTHMLRVAACSNLILDNWNGIKIYRKFKRI